MAIRLSVIVTLDRSAFAHQAGIVGLHMHMIGCICAWNFGTKFF